jgi:hypothetical protein
MMRRARRSRAVQLLSFFVPRFFPPQFRSAPIRHSGACPCYVPWKPSNAVELPYLHVCEG